MNDNLQPLPNEHLEARITAWVLGQASPFEIAELEALCAADPELQLFHNRTKALHSLLLETPPSTADQFWKLSPENRAKLDPIIGPNGSTPSQNHSSIRRAAYRTAFGIAAVLAVTVFIKRFIILPSVMMKESPTIVSYSSMEVEKFNAPAAQEELPIIDARSKGESRSDSSYSYRKPSAPSYSGQAPAKEKDSSLAIAESISDETIPRSEFRQLAGKSPSSRMAAQELDEKAEPPQSSMSKVIAAAQADGSAVFIPVPSVDSAKPTNTFGEGKDFGGGWGSAQGNVGGGEGYASGGGGGAGRHREMSNTALAVEALAVTNDAFASNDDQNKGGFAYTPGEGKKASLKSVRSFRPEEKSAETEKGLEADPFSAQVGEESIVGIPGSSLDTVAGLRSGDYAVQRESIDAILNNPNRKAGDEVTRLPAAEGEGQAPVGGISFSDNGLVQREIARRQNNITEADRSLVEGREAYAKGDYAQAADKYKEALGSVRDIPAQADRLESYSQHLSDASVAQAQQMRKFGKYDEARELLKQAETLSPTDATIKNELGYLEDPIRTNPVLEYEHVEKVDQVRRDLYKAQGNYDLGKYDDAKKSYEDILRIDPHNQAARRGMEKVESTKNDYYRAAYSNTGGLLMEVDKAWELSVPADAPPAVDPFALAAQSGKAQSSSNLDLFGTQEGLTQEDFTKTGVSSSSAALGKIATDESNIPVTPATPSVMPEASEGGLAILGDIPVIGRLFQEGKDGGVESEISVGDKSEYLFRGLALTEKQKPSLVDLSNELSATEESFSTFSLNISDASFQLARAAIEKGERPDPTSIKPEQFYNAIDYGDPAPSASEPVAAAIDQTAHPVIPGRNLVRVALRTASTGRSAAQPLRLTLLVDQSGSMVRADRRVAMENALAQLATLLTEHDQVTVIGFSRTPHLLAESLPGNQAGKLPDIINQTASEGGTNLEQAINLATEQALRHQLAGAQNRIVLFTDGAANLGDADPDRLSKKIQDLRQQGLAFDIAGIGTNDLNDRLLSDLARHGNGRYYLVGEKTGGNLAAQLAGAFRPAAENVKVQVKLNPQRVGNYKLIGFEKDRLKTEDFRNDTVDAAELAADEAGVALYQVETLPEGSGEIGEVSVRFRDTASGEMVERTWTIPYDASAPSFDKANPKTQLATLALLAAQKLQTGPLADAIDFSNYSKTIAQLKQANANSSKTQQLLDLINSIK